MTPDGRARTPARRRSDKTHDRLHRRVQLGRDEDLDPDPQPGRHRRRSARRTPYVGLTTNKPGSEPGEPDKYYPTRQAHVRARRPDATRSRAPLWRRRPRTTAARRSTIWNDKDDVRRGPGPQRRAGAAKKPGIKVERQRRHRPQGGRTTARWRRRSRSRTASCSPARSSPTACRLSRTSPRRNPNIKLFGARRRRAERLRQPEEGPPGRTSAPRFKVHGRHARPDDVPAGGQEVLRGLQGEVRHRQARPVRDLRLRVDGADPRRDQAAPAPTGNDRQAVVKQLLRDQGPHSVLGTYSIDAERRHHADRLRPLQDRRTASWRSTRSSRPRRSQGPAEIAQAGRGPEGRVPPGIGRLDTSTDLEAATHPHRRRQPLATAAAGRSSRKYGLIIVLLAHAGRTTAIQRPRRRRQPRRASATTSSTGLSNGAIWALVALGYTLVYGIIELINFAHGDVFMIGSFVVVRPLRHARARRWPPAPLGLVVGLLVTLIVAMVACGVAQRDDRAGRLPAAAQRAQARAADHGGRLLVHPAERRPAVARRLAAGRAAT